MIRIGRVKQILQKLRNLRRRKEDKERERIRELENKINELYADREYYKSLLRSRSKKIDPYDRGYYKSQLERINFTLEELRKRRKQYIKKAVASKYDKTRDSFALKFAKMIVAGMYKNLKTTNKRLFNIQVYPDGTFTAFGFKGTTRRSSTRRRRSARRRRRRRRISRRAKSQSWGISLW